MYLEVFRELFQLKLHFNLALLSEYDYKQASLVKSSLLIRYDLILSKKSLFEELLHKLDL